MSDKILPMQGTPQNPGPELGRAAMHRVFQAPNGERLGCVMLFEGVAPQRLKELFEEIAPFMEGAFEAAAVTILNCAGFFKQKIVVAQPSDVPPAPTLVQ